MKKACKAYCSKRSKDAKEDWCPGLSAGAIAGIVIACIIVIALVIVLVILTVTHKWPCQSQSSKSEEISDAQSSPS
jgi:hypothetical protein